jgi:8-oxo-dGTP pyrophosphatase MutT (NUDIX family)
VEQTTWDGVPVAREKPFGATVAVFRRVGEVHEWLLLHRHHHGPEYDGDWAWTPPTGARQPGETVEECARREVREEAGLALEPRPTPCGRDEWAVFVAEAPPDAQPRLDDPEHDRFEWLPLEDAVARCLPAIVAEGLACASAHI